MQRQLTRRASSASANSCIDHCGVPREHKGSLSNLAHWPAALIAGAAVLTGLLLVESPAKAGPGDNGAPACDRFGSEPPYVFAPDSGMCLARDRFSVGYTVGVLGSNASAKFGDDSSSNLLGFGGSQGFQLGYTHAWANGWQAGVSGNFIWSDLNFIGMDVSTRVRSFGGLSANFGPTLPGGVHPYVTGGAAFARERLFWWGETASANPFGGSAGVGIEVPLAGSFTGSIEYRHYWFGSTTPFEGGPSFNNEYTTIMAGFNKNLSISSNGIKSLSTTYLPHRGYSWNGIESERATYGAYDPPPQLNFNPYMGGQLGGNLVNFRINTNDDPDTRNIHGSGWGAGAYFGLEAPTAFSGFSTRFEGDYLTTDARATLETMSGHPITKSICGESSINFLGAYRIAEAPAWVAYGGIGAGFVDVTVRTMRDTDHQYGAAFNMIAGVEYNVNSDWAVGLRYTRVQVEPLDFGRTEVKTDANYIGATLTWKPLLKYGNGYGNN
jgi:opacity protein-like surface antigen